MDVLENYGEMLQKMEKENRTRGKEKEDNFRREQV